MNNAFTLAAIVATTTALPLGSQFFHAGACMDLNGDGVCDDLQTCTDQNGDGICDSHQHRPMEPATPAQDYTSIAHLLLEDETPEPADEPAYQHTHWSLNSGDWEGDAPEAPEAPDAWEVPEAPVFDDDFWGNGWGNSWGGSWGGNWGW